MKAIVAQIQHGQGPHFAQTRREGGQTIVVQVHFLDFVQSTEPANRRKGAIFYLTYYIIF